MSVFDSFRDASVINQQAGVGLLLLSLKVLFIFFSLSRFPPARSAVAYLRTSVVHNNLFSIHNGELHR